MKNISHREGSCKAEQQESIKMRRGRGEAKAHLQPRAGTQTSRREGAIPEDTAVWSSLHSHPARVIPHEKQMDFPSRPWTPAKLPT